MCYLSFYNIVLKTMQGVRVRLLCHASLWVIERQLVLVCNLLSVQMLFAIDRIPLCVVTDVCPFSGRLYFFSAFLTGFSVYRAQAH